MTAHADRRPPTDGGKGLKTGALGLVSSVVIGVASTAPAYSLAATLGFIVVVVGLQAPVIVILAFVPMLFTAIGYQELNKADPDCGTTFTWATRAFGPEDGLAGRVGHHRRRRPGHGAAWRRSPASTCSCCSTPTASAATRPAAGCCSSASPGSP